MTPNSAHHNPDPRYLRVLIERAGFTQEAAAQLIGVSGRRMRAYLPLDPQARHKCPYPVQYALESLFGRR